MSSHDYNHKYFQARDYLDFHIAESIKILMEDNHLKRALEVGCGTGRLVKFFNENGFEAVGCDNAEGAIKIARQLNEKGSIVKASATKLPFKSGSFDLIVAISLIEHLIPKEGEKFITEAKRILKTGGFIFLITPNFSSPARFIFGKKWFGYSDPTHKYFFTPRTLACLLKNHGFGKIKLRHKTAYNVKTDLHLPGFCRPWPLPVKNFLNWLMVSSPLATLRDSFWLLAQR